MVLLLRFNCLMSFNVKFHINLELWQQIVFFYKKTQKTQRQSLTFRYDRKMRSYDFGVNFSNVVQVFIYVMPKYEHHSVNIRWDTAKSKCRFSTLKTLPWRHQWRHHSQKVYSLLPMYIVSLKFVQALLLFKIAGEGSQGKKNTRN